MIKMYCPQTAMIQMLTNKKNEVLSSRQRQVSPGSGPGFAPCNDALCAPRLAEAAVWMPIMEKRDHNSPTYMCLSRCASSLCEPQQTVAQTSCCFTRARDGHCRTNCNEKQKPKEDSLQTGLMVPHTQKFHKIKDKSNLVSTFSLSRNCTFDLFHECTRN